MDGKVNVTAEQCIYITSDLDKSRPPFSNEGLQREANEISVPGVFDVLYSIIIGVALESG